jgi:nucleoid DNA-binding protein
MDKMNKNKFLAAVAEKAGVTWKEAGAAWNAVCSIAVEQLRGTGVVTLPGLVKLTVKEVPATPERKGKHPFTGEDHVFPAKPASKRLKASAPKGLKDAVLD